MGTVNVALIGIGNCASSLLQGIVHYGKRDADPVGLTHPVAAGYEVADVRVVAAFDVDAGKVGRDLSEAIWAKPNNALAFAQVKPLDVLVQDGILADGVGPLYAQRIQIRGDATVEQVTRSLRDTESHVVVNFLPVGSQRATEAYAEAALGAGCAFVNCIPSVLARAAPWRKALSGGGRAFDRRRSEEPVWRNVTASCVD